MLKLLHTYQVIIYLTQSILIFPVFYQLLSADSHLNYGEKPIVDVDISVDNCSGMQFATAINRYYFYSLYTTRC